MKKNVMPEVKFEKRQIETKADAEIISALREENIELINKIDELRELLNERNALISLMSGEGVTQ